jgi:hypothetical protein
MGGSWLRAEFPACGASLPVPRARYAFSCCHEARVSRCRFAGSSSATAPDRSRGLDVAEDGNGALRDGRRYQLVREHDAVRERTVEITFIGPGAEPYAFAFG